MSALVTDEHVYNPHPVHADAYMDKRFELLGLAASFAETNGLRRLNATSLARISGIERRIIVRIFPTRSGLIESVWNHQVWRVRQSITSERVSAISDGENVKNASTAIWQQAPLAEEIISSGRDTIVPSAELTLDDLLTDPLIESMNKADRVNWQSYAQLIESASRVLARARSADR